MNEEDRKPLPRVGPEDRSAEAMLRDYRSRWKTGERIRVEAYLALYPTWKADAQRVLELIEIEITLREAAGESPRLDEYVRRFPEHAASLAVHFGTDRAIADNTEIPTTTDTDTDEEPRIAKRPVAVDPTWPIVEGYEILGMLGRGGMGTVYRAYDRKQGTVVALKTVARGRPEALYRFKQEFRALRDVAHPNLVNLYELISDGHDWFLAMELIDGVDFMQAVRMGVSDEETRLEGKTTIVSLESESESATVIAPTGASSAGFERKVSPLSTDRRDVLRRMLRQLAEGVQALHDAGKLHRDIKPANVLVTRQGRVVLLDFGLVAEQDDAGLHLSTEGRVLGTIAYMSPEQATGAPVSPASDWYSVGVMLYETLTGRRPFQERSPYVLMDSRRLDPIPPQELVPDLPDDLASLCVDLLRPVPEERPSGRDVLSRLGEPPTSLVATRGMPGSLVGRERHRAALDAAFDSVVQGRTVILRVHGPSGAGKTALARYFLDSLIETNRAIVLQGRCYERESVPYKALDAAIDALARHLGRLTANEARAFLPRDIQPLARVFPVLRQIEAVALAPRRPAEIPDPLELRRRAFAALRELFARLGDRRPLVLSIDDVQWGDLDSATLLHEILRPPDPPILMLLTCYRSEDAETSPFVRALRDSVAVADPTIDLRELTVDPLSLAEARALSLMLLDHHGPAEQAQAESIARESGGNPFFVAELVRHLQSHTELESSSARDRDVTLDDVLWTRICLLPDDSRRLLEVIAVSGRPIRQSDASRCLDMVTDDRSAIAHLRSGRLIRVTGMSESDEVETYHDRIRETVTRRLSADSMREHHRRLGHVLEAAGGTDPEVLAVHFQGAGERERAASHYERAAEEATEALAFDRAATLYRLALELGPDDAATARRLRAALGGALASGGRGDEAAREYLAAAIGATVAEAFEFRRLASMQLLISGHIDEGLAALGDVLKAVGLNLPSSPRRALLSMLVSRARLRIAGVGFRQRDVSEVSLADLTRIDVCWSAAVGLSVVDTIRGADFQARTLLLALRAGEPSRVARSLAMEAAHSATAGTHGRGRTGRLLEAADRLAKRVGEPYGLGMVALARGVAAYLEGHWRAARGICLDAERLFRDQCTGVAWERDTTNSFALWSLSHLGEVAELARRWPDLLQDARDRGDLYAVMNLSTYLMSVVKLTEGRADEAREELERVKAGWSRKGYHVQHNDQLWAGVQIELYSGRGLVAWELLSDSWTSLARSLLLRVQFIRTAMLSLRGRCALTASLERGHARSGAFLRMAAGDARRLAREGTPWSLAASHVIAAGLASARGDLGETLERLRSAADGFDAAEMSLCAASARYRLGEHLGGNEGAAIVESATGWMRAQGIREPPRIAAMYVPELRVNRPS
jgi:serine/threonine protein kinase